MRRVLLLSSAALASVLSVTPAAAQLAGPKPATTQTGPDAGCIGGVQLVGQPGNAKVASGARLSTSWRIDDISTTPAVCSFPSAQPIEVRCMRAGLAVDPSYCQASEYAALQSQGYSTVAGSSNWATAQWVIPGQTDSGCVGQWQSTDGDKPMGCGTVQVPVTSTCVVTNVQSIIGPDDPTKYCTTPAPAATRSDTDYRACGYAIETGGWGAYNATCGTATHTRSLTCRRADGTALSMSDPNCSSALSTYCSSHTCTGSGDSTQEQETVQLDSCKDPNAGAQGYSWSTGPWQSSGVTCGTDNQTRTVNCTDASGTVVDPSNCPQPAPASTQSENVTSGCSTPAPAAGSCSSEGRCSGGTQIGSTTTTWSGQGYANTTGDGFASGATQGMTSDQCFANGGNCFDDRDLYYNELQNNGNYQQHEWKTCYSGATGIQTGVSTDSSDQYTDSYDKWQVQAQFACSGSGTTPSPTPSPTPTPTPTPTPAAAPTEIQVGWCGYTSSGGGRYACGPYSNYRPGPAAPAGPGALCTGNVLAGDPGDPTTGAGAATQTPNVGPNWQTPPAARSVAGAQCIVHYRAFGYSDSRQEGWESVYYDGPPTGAQGGLFIGPKP